MIFQGDLFWVDLGNPIDSEPARTRPMVVIQNDDINGIGIRTVVMCVLTGTLDRKKDPGNVFLDVDDSQEAGLAYDQCVVNVSQIYTVSMSALSDDNWIGRLPQEKLRAVIEGVKQLL